MAKIEVFQDGSIMFNCPGCGENHRIGIPNIGNWKWNGDINKPTITPSIHLRDSTNNYKTICHLFVTDGKIQFLNDSSHSLVGQTVKMEDIEE